MTGFPLVIVFVIAIIVMIVAISKFNIHAFFSILAVSLIFGLIGGIPLNNVTVDGKTVMGIANVIGAGFSGTFRNCKKISYPI